MKGSLMFLSALLLVLSVGVCAGSAALSASVDEVTVTRLSCEGDKAVLEGLELKLQTYSGNLRWDMTLSPENLEGTDTRFRYDGYGGDIHQEDYPRRYGLELNDATTTWLGYEEGEQPTGFARAYWELEQETPAGEERSGTIRLKDYEPYYRFDITIQSRFDDYIWIHRWRDLTVDETSLEGQFHDFFKIPVLEDEYCEISVEKREDNTVRAWGHGWKEESGKGDAFVLSADFYSSVAAEDAIYFTFSNRTLRDQIVDTSLIPGGYGIYRLPVDPDFDPETEVGFHAGGLKMVYPMDEQTRLLRLSADLEKSVLLLHTIEDENYVLTVIHIPSMTTLQRIPYGKVVGNDWFLWEDTQQELFLVQLPEYEYLLFYRQEDGTYSKEFSFKRDHPLLEHERLSDLAYDGQRLAVVRADTRPIKDVPKSVYSLEVYDRTGLRYAGAYMTSLSQATNDRRLSEPTHTYANAVVANWN